MSNQTEGTSNNFAPNGAPRREPSAVPAPAPAAPANNAVNGTPRPAVSAPAPQPSTGSLTNGAPRPSAPAPASTSSNNVASLRQPHPPIVVPAQQTKTASTATNADTPVQANPTNATASTQTNPATTTASTQTTPIQGGTANSQTSVNAGVAFRTENIGNWKSRQENPFAEQNRKAAEKKSAQAARRKKARPILVIAIGVVVLGLLVWGIIALITALNPPVDPLKSPVITGDSTEAVNDYQGILQEIYDKNDGDFEAVEAAVENTLNTAAGQQYANQVKLAQMKFSVDNGAYAATLGIGDTVNPGALSVEQQILYYGAMYNGSVGMGNNEAANEFFNIRYELINSTPGQATGGGA